MKKHSLLKSILIVFVLVVVLAWVLPTTSLQYGEIVEAGRQQVGLLDIFTYPSLTLYYFSTLFVFVLLIGAFYGVLSKTGAYRTLLDKIVKGFQDREWFFLTLTMILVAAITSLSGLNYAMMFVFPLVISIVLLMGYDKLVAASVTVGPLLIGIMGTTIGLENTPYFSDALNVTAKTEIYTKMIILVLGLVLLIFHTLRYAKKIKSKKAVIEEGLIPEKDKTKRWVFPIAIIFDLALLVMIISYIPWDAVFNITLFQKVTNWIMEYKLFGFSVLSSFLGTITPFGEWTMQQLPMVLLMATVLVGICYRVKFDEFLDGVLTGMKKAIVPAGIMAFIYTILLVLVFHPFLLTIVKFLLGLTKGFNVATMGAVAVISSFFNVDMSFVVQGAMPFVTMTITDTAVYPLIAIMFQSLYALVMLVAPTSVVLMGTLAYLDVPYLEWIKYIWKLLLALFVVLFVIFTIILVI